jgi:hypothetical protein
VKGLWNPSLHLLPSRRHLQTPGSASSRGSDHLGARIRPPTRARVRPQPARARDSQLLARCAASRGRAFGREPGCSAACRGSVLAASRRSGRSDASRLTISPRAPSNAPCPPLLPRKFRRWSPPSPRPRRTIRCRCR